MTGAKSPFPSACTTSIGTVASHIGRHHLQDLLTMPVEIRLHEEEPDAIGPGAWRVTSSRTIALLSDSGLRRLSYSAVSRVPSLEYLETESGA